MTNSQTSTYTYITNSDSTDSNCPSETNIAISSISEAIYFLTSDLSYNSLADNLDCEITITGPTDSQLLINFQTINLQGETINDCNDYVQFTAVKDPNSIYSFQAPDWQSTFNASFTYLVPEDSSIISNTNTTYPSSSHQYCGTNTYQRVSPNSIITQQNIVKIKLFTDNSYNSNGASFIISPINSIDLNENNIDQNVFCNNQLIHQNLVCDNILNCYDSTDESIGNSLGANLCPVSEPSLGVGYIILYIIVGILVLLIILGISYLIYKRVQIYYLKKELFAMEEKVMADENLKRDEAGVLQNDIFDLM